MINKLIEKYEEKLMKLTLLKGIDEKCQIHNAKTYAKKEAYSEIIKDLEELKTEYKKVLSDTSDTILNNFLGVDIDE